MNQYAYHPQHRTIHSCGQLEWFYNDVNDKSCKIPGGLQRIKTNDGYILPLQIREGLPYLPLRPYTDKEWDTLPHVVLTSDDNWNPQVFDHSFDLSDETWYDALEQLEDSPMTNLFDECGNYLYRTVCESKITSPTPIDYKQYAPYFAYMPESIITKTFNNTTQYAKQTVSTVMKRHFKSPFPALNVHRRNEPVATDTVYSNTPAIDGGQKYAQVFIGTKTLLSDVHPMKTDGQFVNTLEDNIIQRGAMNQLISDSA